jgi:hypothetical protein
MGDPVSPEADARTELERTVEEALCARYRVRPSVFDDRVVGKKVKRVLGGWRLSPFWAAVVAAVVGTATPTGGASFDKTEAREAFNEGLRTVCAELPELLEDHTNRGILPSTLRAVYHEIVRWAEADGLAWVPMERLAKDLEYDVRTVRRAVRALEKLGALATFERWLPSDREPFTAGYRTNIYLPFNPSLANWGQRGSLTEIAPASQAGPSEAPRPRAPTVEDASPTVRAQVVELSAVGEALQRSIVAQIKACSQLAPLIPRAGELALYAQSALIAEELSLKGLRELAVRVSQGKYPCTFDVAKAFMREAVAEPPSAEARTALGAAAVLSPEERAERKRIEGERDRLFEERAAERLAARIASQRKLGLMPGGAPVAALPPAAALAALAERADELDAQTEAEEEDPPSSA